MEDASLLYEYSQNAPGIAIEYGKNCWFPGLAISNAKMYIYFSDKMYGSNLIEQHSETVMVLNCPNADCSFRQ